MVRHTLIKRPIQNFQFQIRLFIYIPWLQRLSVVHASRMSTYTVYVTIHSGFGAGIFDYITLMLVGTEKCSKKTLLHGSLFKQETGVVKITVTENLGDILFVKLEKEENFRTSHCYCKYITVRTPHGEYLEFPCYQWLPNNIFLGDGRARLPQDENISLLRDHRQKELEYRQKQFRWKEWRPGFPMSIDANSYDELPLEVLNEKKVESLLNVKTVMNNLKLTNLMRIIQPPWSDISDFNKMFLAIRESMPEYIMRNWNEDIMFGYQFLNGTNPVIIKKCMKLPDKLPVTQEMVGGSLERGLTLEEEIKAGNIYIADYEILDGVQANATDPSTPQYLAAPICLLYKNSQNQIIPIAIQLDQTPGVETPVFLPHDDRFDWMLAKMWVKSSDFNVHQLITHLLGTHLISEVFTIAMYRQLSAVHPVYKLVIPHVRFTIAINTKGRQTLFGKTGILEKVASAGGKAMVDVIQKAMKTLTYKSLCFPEAIKARGMDNQKDLPNFYYRDDGIMVWEAVKNFVMDVVKIYYGSDEAVQKDNEIQAFVKDVCCSGMKNSATCEFPKSLETREQLIEYLTVVIFTASAQHAAVNFGQYDWFAWVPNSPSTMRKPPPTVKGQVDMKYIMETLPDRGRSCLILGIVWALSQFEKDELFLGMYTHVHFTEHSVMDAMKTFRKKLVEVTNIIKSRNETLKLPYWYLSPDRIPNSVAI